MASYVYLYMKFPKGYSPTFNIADNILRHLNNPEMRAANFTNKLLAEPEHQIQEILLHLKSDNYIKYSGTGFTASITPAGIKFISEDGYLEQFKIHKIDKFKKKYWWLIALVSFLLGFIANIILEYMKLRILQ